MTAKPDYSRRPAAGEHAPYYATYVSHVPEGPILDTLQTQLDATVALIRGMPEVRGDHRYASGKWSIREVLGHITDAERVFSYRAMCFARNEEAHLPSFDENAWIASSCFGERSLASLADDFTAARRSTLSLLGTMNADEWERSGMASIARMSVRAAAWVIAGHELHHVNILKSRYL